MRVAVIGSRSVTDEYYPALCAKLPIGVSEIISGGASGADILAARYATENDLPLLVFKPDYQRYGRAAPLKRNQQIIAHADYVLALWDGHSRGTAYVIDACIRAYTPVRIILCRKDP